MWKASSINKENDLDPPEEPERPIKPPPAKPKMLIVLPELIEQWAAEINMASQDFTTYIYHGDERQAKSGHHRKIQGKLTRTHDIFNGAERNARVVVITSVITLRARHGPSALKLHRTSRLGHSSVAAQAMLEVNDPNWEYNLEGLFEYVTIDEAHVVKNADTMSHKTVTWLKPHFLLMATATVLSNRIEDFGGYMKLMEPEEDLWTNENLNKWGVEYSVNPYILPDNHPATVLRFTSRAVERWITGDKKDLKTTGVYLEKIWSKVMIRRTYASPNPQFPHLKIASNIAAFHSRRISCMFDEQEWLQYEDFAAEANKKLITVLDNGNVIWNRKWSRRLILLSSWLGFHYVEELFRSESTPVWKSLDQPLYVLIKKLHTAMDNGVNPLFEMPDKDDIVGQVAVICRGSPKLRSLLKMVAELVIVHDKKIIIWCALPATQVFIYIILQALGITASCYSAELSMEERTKVVADFCDPRGAKCFIGGFHVGSTGHNLQACCHHSAMFDAPPNKGSEKQSIGRIRRIGQPYTVENFEFSVVNSFQNRQIRTNILKALPGAMAELTINIRANPSHEDEDEEPVAECEFATWYLHDGILIQAPDPRLENLTLTPLSPHDLVLAILQASRGEHVHIKGDTFDVEDIAEIEPLSDLYEAEPGNGGEGGVNDRIDIPSDDSEDDDDERVFGRE